MKEEKSTRTYRFTPQQTADLFKKTVTVARREQLTKKAEARIDYIVTRITDVLKSKLDWYEFFSVNEESGKNFNHDEYSKSISLVVDAASSKYNIADLDDEFTIKGEPKFSWSNSDKSLYIPTKWLHEDFEPSLIESLDKVRADHKNSKVKESVSIVKAKKKSPRP